jgi:glycosyltransferase involved in cell wall biosynthesis
MAACDIYAAPARLEGFGMPQVEAGACEKPVIGMRAMGMLDTLVHGETAYLARVGEEVVATEAVRGPEAGFEDGHRVVFDRPRTVDYRAAVDDIAEYLKMLMTDPLLRLRMGKAARSHVVPLFDYRVVARAFVEIIHRRLGIS